MWGWGRWTLPADADLILGCQDGKPANVVQNVFIATVDV